MSGKRYPEEFKIEAVKQVAWLFCFQRCNTSRYHHPQSLRLDKEVRAGLFQ
ncbi:UNVERIFIED_ORG: hypothetical protein J2806_000617 [Kosakonia oryzae]|uniref:Transposase n=1 Tax=Kosakonia radicincitans TaxID=283686 RepID=A0AAX2ELS6_9ENTR|nr:hypothetical protein [Kosakonia oryzae]SFD92121.1 hypothetical protein SAMN03159468_00390 [Kosakonia radicincitans]SFQ97451.1 hypothetical protein SAMN03159514_00389 [Kosakonia radicincitans]SFT40075.1 hypothetical protein SAMN03159428_00388 [Kosakonia radicincitans]SFX09449.1 hypothetical protein SAMN03159436_00388 [Kosakonia radicincitans]